MDMLGHSIFNVQKLPINLTILNILKDMPRFYITHSLPCMAGFPHHHVPFWVVGFQFSPKFHHLSANPQCSCHVKCLMVEGNLIAE
jgi:hypothetical protein